MKRLLLLGGSTQQVPAIKYSKKQGCFTVLCDYLPDNPGQHYADKFYCISTTDKDTILEVARKEKVDGIVAYASDPAAPTAAYVAEEMGLPTNPYKSVEVLAMKDKFRQFLMMNKFNCPLSDNFHDTDQALVEINRFTYPVMVKPVDSSGSKGVRRVDCYEELAAALESAMSLSRSKNIIIEEYIEQSHKYMIGGDCFVLNGKVEFWGLLNCHRDRRVNPLVPVGKSYPLLMNQEQKDEIYKTIQRMVDLLDIQFGGFNVELMWDKRGKLYLIEMGPRNGGNMIPDLLQMITGVDLIAATVETALGNTNVDLHYKLEPVYYATYNLHSAQNGRFQRIELSNKIEKEIVKQVIYKKPGDSVQFFDVANKAIGIMFMKFESMNEMLEMMDNADQWINVVVE